MHNQNKTLDSIIYAFSLGWWCDPILGVVYKPDGAAAKQYISKNGYFVVNLPRRNPSSATSTWKSCCLHRIIAYCRWGLAAFAGHKVVHVRHLDGVRTNNSYDNLLLGTPSENARDVPREVRAAMGKKRWEAMTDTQKQDWFSKVKSGLEENRESISARQREHLAADKPLSDARLNYARDVKYGRINKSELSFVDYYKAQQGYTEGKALESTGKINPA